MWDIGLRPLFPVLRRMTAAIPPAGIAAIRCARASTGTVRSHAGKVSTAAGQFDNAAQILYRGPCADAGVSQQFLVPDIGLVFHEETSFAGPREYELIYYRAGGRSESAPEIGFTVALDSARYSPGAVLGVRLTLRSTSAQSLVLEFPSGQSYDLKVTNEKGEVVYTWSAGRAFTMIYRTENFGPGEKTYGLAAPLDNLPPGRYQVEAWLTTSPIMYRGMASFEIRGGRGSSGGPLPKTGTRENTETAGHPPPPTVRPPAKLFFQQPSSITE